MAKQVTIGCVIMASGQSRRFGKANKLLTPVCGSALLSHSIQSVPEYLFDVVVSTRWEEVARLCRLMECACVVHRGVLRSHSVRAGMAYAENRHWLGCLFLPGDQPLVSHQSFEALAESFARRPSCIHRLALEGQPGSPILFPSSFFEGLMNLEGSDGGRSLITKNESTICCEAHHAWEFWDVDTPEDAQRIEEFIDASTKRDVTDDYH